MICHWILNKVSVIYSRTLLFSHSIYKNLHLLTPISHSMPSPTPTPSLLAITGLFSMFMILFLFHRYVLFCHIKDSIYVVLYAICLSLSDFTSMGSQRVRHDRATELKWAYTSLSIIISSYVHVAANDILSFLWLGSIPLCICTTSSLSIYLLMKI